MKPIISRAAAVAMSILFAVGCNDAPAPTSALNLPRARDCLDLAASEDADIQRNASMLASANLCLRLVSLRENGINWLLRVIESDRSGPLWVVLHDNETSAFDSGAYAVSTYGGSMVAVETGGQRNNGDQDPNRNFGVGRDCPRAHADTPAYIAAILPNAASVSAIIALHTNERGYAGDGAGGAGHISIDRPGATNTAFPAAPFPGAASAADTLVFVAGQATDPSAELSTIIRMLTAQRVNVIYEHVSSESYDCSLSNYAATRRIGHYFNVEVAHGDGETQRRIVDILAGVIAANP